MSGTVLTGNRVKFDKITLFFDENKIKSVIINDNTDEVASSLIYGRARQREFRVELGWMSYAPNLKNMNEYIKNFSVVNLDTATKLLNMSEDSDNKICVSNGVNRIELGIDENTKYYMINGYTWHGDVCVTEIPTHVWQLEVRKQVNKYSSNKSRKGNTVRGYGIKITPTLRMAVMQRDRKCLCCGRDISDGVKLEVDHIIPVSMGGDTIEDNLQTLCVECNRGKGTHNFDFLHK